MGYNASMVNSSNKVSAVDRFWRSVKKTPSCWLWSASTDTNGYGQIKHNGKAVTVHRFSYELHKGKIPKGNWYGTTCVMHKCDNPRCVNPGHLILGTQQENLKDRDSKGRLASKINRKIADEIRRLYIPRKVSQYKLAKRYGISRSAVEDIIHNRTWR